MASWSEESYNFFLGGPPKLEHTGPVVKNLDQRKFLTTMSSGSIHIQCDIVIKGLKKQDAK